MRWQESAPEYPAPAEHATMGRQPRAARPPLRPIRYSYEHSAKVAPDRQSSGSPNAPFHIGHIALAGSLGRAAHVDTLGREFSTVGGGLDQLG